MVHAVGDANIATPDCLFQAAQRAGKRVVPFLALRVASKRRNPIKRYFERCTPHALRHARRRVHAQFIAQQTERDMKDVRWTQRSREPPLSANAVRDTVDARCDLSGRVNRQQKFVERILTVRAEHRIPRTCLFDRGGNSIQQQLVVIPDFCRQTDGSADCKYCILIQ